MESKQEAYSGVRERLQRLLASCHASRPCSTEHSLRILEQKWESVHAEAQERKVRGAGGRCPPGGADPALAPEAAGARPRQCLPPARRSAWPRG